MTTGENSYRYLREAVGLIERRDRRYLELLGPDSVDWLQRMVSNDVAALQPAEGCYACLLDEKGKLIVDLQILRLDSEIDASTRAVFVIAVEGDLGTHALDELDRFLIMEDAELRWHEGALRTLAVHGPGAPALLAKISAGELPTEPLARYAHRSFDWAGHRVRAVGSADFGEAGYDLILAAEGADALRSALIDAGAEEVSEAAAHTARIEAFVPRTDIELTRDTIPFDVGIDHAVHLSKGCYRGQETIARFDARGRGKHRLAGLRFAGLDAPPPAGAVVLRRGDTPKAVGELRSSCMSPAVGDPIGVAHVLSVDGAAGNLLLVQWDGGQAEAEVVATPFYSSTR